MTEGGKMSEKENLDRLYEELRKEFVRCMFPNGREAYMREFEAKFETSVNNMDVSGEIYRGPSRYWKNRT
jgi:hypothetical protein